MTPRKKKEALRWFLRNDNVTTAIVFSNKKTTVRDLAKTLKKDGFKVGEIHGDMDQSSRIAELDLFKSGAINILAASDVAARGLDIKGVSHVFNYDTPWHPDDYVHRVGRTGRAGAKGRAFTFVTREDAEAIANVEKLTGGEIPLYAPAKPAPVADAKSNQDVREAPRSRARNEQAPREENTGRGAAPQNEEKKPRSRRKPADEGVAPERSEPVEAKPTRAPRQISDKAPERRRTRQSDSGPPTEPGEWNGPIPGFLEVSAT